MAEAGYIRYREIKFTATRERAVLQAAAIIDEYAVRGMTMSVRQVYYQLVQRNLIPNDDREYDKLQGLINDGRLAGYISWTAIEDRNRSMMSIPTYEHPRQAIERARDRYRRALWEDQPFFPVVLVEKAALEGVISAICAELRVDFAATRGYNSQSETWRLAQGLLRRINRGQRPIIFHLGDHDPSGLHMTEDLSERLEMFVGMPVMVQRLALNLAQVDQYDPPPNPAKVTDSRHAGYVDYMMRAGHVDQATYSWELDALDPSVIQDLIRSAVDRVRDGDLWQAALAREADERDTLDLMVEQLG